MGLVEPLGFPESALRTKRAAVDAIDEVGAGDRFKLLHDTFHHYLAGEQELFPERTGPRPHLGRRGPQPCRSTTIRDEHRVLVGPADLMDNAGQIRALLTGGYAGPFSLEPFSPDRPRAGRARRGHPGKLRVRRARRRPSPDAHHHAPALPPGPPEEASTHASQTSDRLRHGHAAGSSGHGAGRRHRRLDGAVRRQLPDRAAQRHAGLCRQARTA